MSKDIRKSALSRVAISGGSLMDSVNLDLGSRRLRGHAATAHRRLGKAVTSSCEASVRVSFDGARQLLRDLTVPELNRGAGIAIEQAYKALRWLRGCPVVYISHAPVNQPEFAGEYIDTTFDDLLFRNRGGVVVDGLASLIAIRALPTTIQWQLVRFLVVRHRQAKVASHHWGGSKAEQQAELTKGKRQQTRFSRGIEEFARLGEQCFDDLTQEGEMAIPFQLAPHPTREAIEIWTRAVVQLASEFSRPFDDIRGTKRLAAQRRWAAVDECADLLRLLAAWGRSLSSMFTTPLCDLCYRHSASKLRCATHTLKSTVSRVARLATHVHDDYRKVKRSLAASVVRPGGNALHWSRYESDESLQGARDLLERQLKQLSGVFGPSLLASALDLVEEICMHVQQQYQPGRASSSAANGRLLALVSLRGFWMLWCLRGPANEFSGLGHLSGRGYDQYNPLARIGGINADHMADAIIRQRAWQHALKEYVVAYAKPMDFALSLSLDGLSLRMIGALIGISAPAASRWIDAASSHPTGTVNSRKGYRSQWEEYDELKIVSRTARTTF